MTISNFHTLEGEGEDRAYYIDQPACSKCEPFDGSELLFEQLHPEIPVQYFCVGLIPYIPDPKDDHEKYNRIRCCIASIEKLFMNEWTPWEAHRLGIALANISSQFLLKDQPGEAWEEVENILKRRVKEALSGK